MKTLHVGKSAGETEAAPDSSWSSLYRAGSISAALFIILIIVSIVLLMITPPAPASGGAATLQYIASHRSLYILQQALWLAPSLMAMVVFLALYMALKHLNKSYAAIGALVGITSWAISLAVPTTGGGAPALVPLSDLYATATTAAQHAAFAAAAETLIAQNNAVNAVGILQTLGILLISLVMLKGVFHKGVAYLGIVTGVLGIVSESLRPILGPGYLVYGLLLPAWFIAVGWSLYRLGASSSHAMVAKKLEVQA